MKYEIEDAEIITNTDEAVLVRAPIFDEDQWIPFSQIHDDSEVYTRGDSGTLIINTWFAELKGWD